MDIVRQLDEHPWREFVDNHPQSQVFHTPEMFQVFERTKGYVPTLWAAVDDGHHPLALFLPVQITLKGGLLRRFTTRAVSYGSVLGAPGAEGKEAVALLLETYARKNKGRFLFTESRNMTDLGDLQPVLGQCGFVYEDHLNFTLDLTQPQDQIWGNIRSNARRNIRKAQKSQVTVEMVERADRLGPIYALLKSVYQRLQVPLVDESFFRSAWDISYPKGMFKVLVARVQGIDIGAMTLLLHKGIVLYWYAGILKEYTSYRAGDLLVWHALEWASQNGFRLFDFGGAGKPQEEYGVRDFKAKFGGELVNYGRNICVHAPMTFKLSEAVYQVARRFLYGKATPEPDGQKSEE